MALHADDIRDRVQTIADLATVDYERAHRLEDALLLDTLAEIARDIGDSTPSFYRFQALARAALKVCDIEYPRHCA
jgi:hypothetical protein